MATPHRNNYTLGRGKLSFGRFAPGTFIAAGERYLGNTPEYNATIETETLDHYNSDEGINEKDESITLQTNRTATFITDNVSAENIALFFFGSSTALVSTGASVSGEAFDGVIAGLTYQLGRSPTSPTGVRGLSQTNPPVVRAAGAGAPVAATGTVTFADTGDVADTVTIGSTVYTLVAAPAAPNEVLIGASATATAANLSAAINAGAGSGTVYGAGTVANASAVADPASGTVTLTARTAGTTGNTVALAKTGTDITVSGATLTGGTGAAFEDGVDYTVDLARGRLTILQGGAITSGTDIEVDYETETTTRSRIISGSNPISGSLHYQANNPVGENYDWYMPYVKISPNGDYALKGDDWQQIPFNVEILKLPGYEAIYIDGQATTL